MRPLSLIIAVIFFSALTSFVIVKTTTPSGNVQHLSPHAQSAYDLVVKTGTLRCGYAASPPNLTIDPNTKKLSGIDYDVWQAIGKQLGLKIEWTEEAGWGNFIEGLRANRYDAFCSQLWTDTTRTKYLSLTRPMVYSMLGTYVRSGDHRFDGNLDKLNSPDFTIPVIDGDVSVMMLETGFPQAKALTLPQTATLSDMFLSVITGKADALFLDPTMFSAFEKDNQGKLELVKNVPNSFVFSSRYGVKSGEIQLRDMIDTALQTLLDDGRLEKIIRHYSENYTLAKKNY